ncbi:divalent metal cation transporter, partial [Balneolaceae bacterium ANBcel3]|nr:divalent metal cation transporter [Balneolaceae bacterium ANBcel3]
TIVTAGLAEHLFGTGWTMFVWSVFILAACIVLLLAGRYPGLDRSMKIIISLLTICTLLAVLMALSKNNPVDVLRADTPSYWNLAGIAFIIAFMGWMPIPLDAAVWHSIWTREKSKQTGALSTLRGVNIDFNVGYIAAAFVGFLFFLLGALVMFGHSEEFSASSVLFSAQLIEMYGQTLGSWSVPLISIAAFITMFSTTLAVTDAYPRVMSELWKESGIKDSISSHGIYRISLILIPSVALLLLFYLTVSFTTLVDFAAGLSFLAAPVLAFFNFKLITGKGISEEAKPGIPARIFSWACLLFLTLFALTYLYWQIWLR